MDLINAITGTQAPNSSYNLAFGFGGAGLCALLFGSNFVPVKKVDMGDGLFFQFIMCNAIMIAGIVIQIVRHSPKFYPLVMVGGAMWALGNVCVVPILKTIGLGLGILIWSTVNMLCGWASGRFGLFDTEEQVPKHVILNYVGIALCGFSALVYLFIKPQLSDDTPYERFGNDNNVEETPFSEITHFSVHESVINEYDNDDKVSNLTNTQKRIVGCILAIISGALYGFSFSPVYYVMNNYDGASKSGLDYVFAQYAGIFAASTVFIMIYSATKKNEPVLVPKAVLPGYLSGVMWTIADIGWFVVNEILGEEISFPIITAGSSLVAILWSVFLFKEIRGLCNLIILGIAFSVTVAGITLTTLSKG